MNERPVRDLLLVVLLVIALVLLDQVLPLPGFPALFDEATPWSGGEAADEVADEAGAPAQED